MPGAPCPRKRSFSAVPLNGKPPFLIFEKPGTVNMSKKTNGAPKAFPARTDPTCADCDGTERGRQVGARTLGPVSDLERHLPSDWWRTLFNSLYLETDGDVIENDRNTSEEVDLLIRTVGLERNDRILDLCCGQGRHSLELAWRGFPHVTGLDRSRYLIRLARKRAKQRGLQVSFHEGDARRFRLGDAEFHCVCLLGNSFGLFRASGGRSRRTRSGQARPRFRSGARYGSNGWRVDASSFRSAFVGVD